MAKIHIANHLDSPPSPFPVVAGLDLEPGIGSHDVFGDQRQSLRLFRHALPAGAVISVRGPAVGQAFYIWGGTVDVDGQEAPPATAILAAHGAETRLTAGSAGASLLHFFTSEPVADRAGGCVHVVKAAAVRRFTNEAETMINGAYADSSCPTCALWLHESKFAPDYDGAAHFHTRDEIIVVTDGDIRLGARQGPVGASLAIAANATYAFRAGPGGLSFINFRNAEASYALHQGGVRSELKNEREALERMRPYAPS